MREHHPVAVTRKNQRNIALSNQQSADVHSRPRRFLLSAAKGAAAIAFAGCTGKSGGDYGGGRGYYFDDADGSDDVSLLEETTSAAGVDLQQPGLASDAGTLADGSPAGAVVLAADATVTACSDATATTD